MKLLQTALLTFFIATGFYATAQTADEIIDKYIAAIGGKENWKKIFGACSNQYDLRSR